MTPEEYLKNELVTDDAGAVGVDGTEQVVEVSPKAAKSSFKDLEPSTQRLVWLVIGVACILALVIPGAYVYTRNAGAPIGSTDVVIVPVTNGEDNDSSETTKTVKPSTPEPAKPSAQSTLGEEYEDWDYQTLGRNILAPAKGLRVMDYEQGLNPKYEGTYIDALDIETHAAEIARLNALPTISGRAPATPIDDDGSGTPGTTFTAIKLTGIGTNSGVRVAVFSVDGSTYEAEIGEEIDSTGWSVTSISSTSVVISDGASSRTLVLPNGSK